MYRILVAEDEPIERKVLCKNLQKHLGGQCQVLEAKNGREAVELFLQHRPQVAILDIEMPGLSGLEAARQIRACGLADAGSIPVIALSADVDPESAKRCIEAGMSACLSKPINTAELFATLSREIMKAEE